METGSRLIEWSTSFESNPGFKENADLELLRYVYEGVKIE